MATFKILHKSRNARVGRLQTSHGIVETPNFIPVGTQGSVKALSPKDLNEIGVQIVLANTYHLMLRPGVDLIQSFGGLHKFMSWDKPIMTDSGGYQVFSLGVALEHGARKVLKRNETEEVPQIKPRLNSITEEGVIFKSHLDGSKYLLTPEKSIEIQFKLGVDLIVAFDDHESSKFSKNQLIKSLELTEKWAIRSLEAHKKLKSKQLIYGVVHGSADKNLRIRSAKFTDQHFNAIAIGGIYIDRKSLYQMIEWVVNNVSDEKPRHMLGIGEVEDLFECVERGMDFFDCVAPTRRARNGSLYISPKNGVYPNFTLNIRKSEFAKDKKPIDPYCFCYTCRNFSRAYLRHLYMSREILFSNLATYHNIYFYTKLMEEIREHIKAGTFKKFKNVWI